MPNPPHSEVPHWHLDNFIPSNLPVQVLELLGGSVEGVFPLGWIDPEIFGLNHKPQAELNGYNFVCSLRVTAGSHFHRDTHPVLNYFTAKGV